MVINLLFGTYSNSSSRELSSSGHYVYSFPWSNFTDDTDDFVESQLQPAKDVSVDAVLSSLLFNTVAFVILMASYEIIRRLLPAVYSSRQRLLHTKFKTGYHYHDTVASPSYRNRKGTVNLPSRSSINQSGSSKTSKTSSLSAASVVSAAGVKTDASAVAGTGGTRTEKGIDVEIVGIGGGDYHTLVDVDDSDRGNKDSKIKVDTTDVNRDDDGEILGEQPSAEISTASAESERSQDSFVLPDSAPLDWIGPVFGVPWSTVRKKAGLDGYFFLRYIRMCLRITVVTTFWAFVILVPIYGTGVNQTNVTGWYHISAANVPVKSWRMTAPVIFAYLFSSYIFFVIKQEYRHFLQLRMEFLAKGDEHVNPQHHYSLMVENIPCELRSDNALFDYFDKLFPGKVHSASVCLNLPDLEALSARCLRVCRRLEKSIAYYKARGTRPTHIVGAKRLTLLGIQIATFDCLSALRYCNNNNEVVYCHENAPEKPKRGTRVDSISYYTMDLAACNRFLRAMQIQKTKIAQSGKYDNAIVGTNHWLSKVLECAQEAAEKIMDDSHEVNDLQSPNNSFYSGLYQQSSSASDQQQGLRQRQQRAERRTKRNIIPQAEMMSSWYGSMNDNSIHNANKNKSIDNAIITNKKSSGTSTGPSSPHVSWSVGGEDSSTDLQQSSKRQSLLTREDYTEQFHDDINISDDVCNTGGEDNKNDNTAPSTPPPPPSRVPGCNDFFGGGVFDIGEETNTELRRFASRIGLDYVVYGLRFFNRQIDVALEEIVGSTMSSTGFVTFLDLTTVTAAASIPLTTKPTTLEVSVAPNPHEIKWENVHISKKTRENREQIVNIFLYLGVILWSFPLAAIQAFAKAENIAQIPGMEWILTSKNSTTLTYFVNGYLPVLALLVLILILPVMFETIAVRYERRKTFSDVQTSMLGRYFYYQLANIYITVTAGSLWKSLGGILDNPSMILQLFGESLPQMVGYFVALLVTKILAGLPMIFLRFGALSRMVVLLTLSREKKLAQRELDAIYRPENVQYGWEFPSQLLVIVIVFTYAIICPIILPVGLCYFLGSLIVYKKQVLYVYTPIYESGGAMFPAAVQRTIFGLVCGQMTLIGYMVIRGCHTIPIMLAPLPLYTIYVMNYFRRYYAVPSQLLSMERAREFDQMSDEQGLRRNVADRNRLLSKQQLPDVQERNQSRSEQTLSLSSSNDNDNNNNDTSDNAFPSLLRQRPKPFTESDRQTSFADIAIEQRKNRFDKDSYRQPVISQVAMEPLMYRRGRDDSLTREARETIRRIQLRNDTDPDFNTIVTSTTSPVVFPTASNDSNHIIV